MALMVECPNCKKRLGETAKICRSRTGKGCGAKIPQGQKIYWIAYRDAEGKARQKRVGPSKMAAKNLLRDIKTAIVEDRYIHRPKHKAVPTIQAFCDDHYHPWCEANNKGYYQKKNLINRVAALWGSKRLDELTYKDVAKFQWQMKKAKKTTMFNRILTVVRHMYTIARKMDLIDHNPIAETNDLRFKEKGRLRYLMPDEVERLIAACADHLRPVVLTAVHTGMRKSEVLSLKLGSNVGENVDLNKQVITLHETKNDEKRFIPINQTVMATLAPLCGDKKPGDYIFCRPDGTPYLDMKKSFASAIKDAKITDFTFHDLRHTFASNLVMDGVDLYVVKELLGHKDIKMTMRYAHLAPEHKTKAVTVLDRIFGIKNGSVCLYVYQEKKDSGGVA